MGSSHRIGRRGEDYAERTLRARGWEILDRNWRAGPRELDLVVRRGAVVAFVEVKTRGGDGCGAPLESITPAKRREVERAAALWMHERASGLAGVCRFRFDAVSVHLTPGRRVRFRHVADAWRIGDP